MVTPRNVLVATHGTPLAARRPERDGGVESSKQPCHCIPESLLRPLPSLLNISRQSGDKRTKEDLTMASKKLILTLTCIAAVAVLAVGCGSDDNDSPTAPVVDTAPPALPINLQA